MNPGTTSRSIVRAAGALLLAALCAAPSVAPSEAPATLAPLVTIAGVNSHVTEARCLLVTTSEAWSALLLEHAGEAPKRSPEHHFNRTGLPVVDFERCMVVAVFAGATTNCAGVSAVAGPVEDPDAETKTPVASGDEVLRINWHSYQSGPEADHVTPFGFFVLPRGTAPLLVQERFMPLGGGRGRLTQLARLPAPGPGR